MTTCKARQQSDMTYHCKECHLSWDMDDPDPPSCKPVKLLSPEEISTAFNNLRASLVDSDIMSELKNKLTNNSNKRRRHYGQV